MVGGGNKVARGGMAATLSGKNSGSSSGVTEHTIQDAETKLRKVEALLKELKQQRSELERTVSGLVKEFNKVGLHTNKCIKL